MSMDGAGVGLGSRLRIVLATYSLAYIGGTESYAVTVAHELRRLGHDVTLAAEELGPVAELAERDGLRVARLPTELPRQCDVAIVQDAIVTAPVVDRYPGAGIVHVAHSDIFDHQLPVLTPGIVHAVVALSGRLEMRMRALALEAPIVRLRQPIDTDRFVSAGPLPPRPRRALLLGNYLRGERRDALLDAWSSAGIEFTQVGGEAHHELDVRPAITEADIVVAKSRAALEGMACARAVYVYDEFGGDGWITPERYDGFEADGFAGLASEKPRRPADLAADVEGYSAEMGWINREIIRTHHSARRHTARLVDVLRDVASAHTEGISGLEEVSRFARLVWHAERRTIGFQHQAAAAASRAVASDEEARGWESRALSAEEEAQGWGSRAHAAEEEMRGWKSRARDAESQLADAESQLAEARWLLGTRRSRVGFALGGMLDRVRGQR
ncbi:MAG TPA: hypothetical protein VGH93_00850 [Solirubrobacteraceae bacterium]